MATSVMPSQNREAETETETETETEKIGTENNSVTAQDMSSVATITTPLTTMTIETSAIESGDQEQEDDDPLTPIRKKKREWLWRAIAETVDPYNSAMSYFGWDEEPLLYNDFEHVLNPNARLSVPSSSSSRKKNRESSYQSSNGSYRHSSSIGGGGGDKISSNNTRSNRNVHIQDTYMNNNMSVGSSRIIPPSIPSPRVSFSTSHSGKFSPPRSMNGTTVLSPSIAEDVYYAESVSPSGMSNNTASAMTTTTKPEKTMIMENKFSKRLPKFRMDSFPEEDG